MPPLVSIIIPCYNAERFVGEAIRSALDQTYSPTEIIVIDDGSTDRSLEIIKSFGDRIRWESQPNRGGSAARNRGLQPARGELIQFLDADDLLLPQKLARQVEALSSSTAAMTFCDVEVMSNGERRIPLQPYRGGDPVAYMLAGGNPPTSGPLHRRACIEAAGGFREDLPCAQEFDLHLRIACAGHSFHYIPERLWKFRVVPGSVSSDYSRVLDQLPRILWPAYEALRQRGTLSDERKKAFAEAMVRAARHYLRLGRTASAREYFEQARRMHESGGLGSYRRPARLLLRLCGPVLTERLVALKRNVLPSLF